MKILSKANLITEMAKSILNKDKYFAVEVNVPNCKESQTEIIINKIEALDTKIEYYSNAYDENLFLKNCSDIFITNFTRANSFEEIELKFKNRK